MSDVTSHQVSRSVPSELILINLINIAWTYTAVDQSYTRNRNAVHTQ